MQTTTSNKRISASVGPSQRQLAQFLSFIHSLSKEARFRFIFTNLFCPSVCQSVSLSVCLSSCLSVGLVGLSLMAADLFQGAGWKDRARFLPFSLSLFFPRQSHAYTCPLFLCPETPLREIRFKKMSVWISFPISKQCVSTMSTIASTTTIIAHMSNFNYKHIPVHPFDHPFT